LTPEDGLHVKVDYAPLKDQSFRDAPAWEADHIEPLIERLVWTIRRKLRERNRIENGGSAGVRRA
jgi:hypothetical protein